jgi:hypothetical protein
MIECIQKVESGAVIGNDVVRLPQLSLRCKLLLAGLTLLLILLYCLLLGYTLKAASCTNILNDLNQLANPTRKSQ